MGPAPTTRGVWESLRASPHLHKVLQVHLPNKYFLTFPTGSELWAGLGQFLDCSQPGWPSPEGGGGWWNLQIRLDLGSTFVDT